MRKTWDDKWVMMITGLKGNGGMTSSRQATMKQAERGMMISKMNLLSSTKRLGRPIGAITMQKQTDLDAR